MESRPNSLNKLSLTHKSNAGMTTSKSSQSRFSINNSHLRFPNDAEFENEIVHERRWLFRHERRLEQAASAQPRNATTSGRPHRIVAFLAVYAGAGTFAPK